MGPTTDSPFAPGEHIPGLDRGGWYDAGDFDIRTQTQAQAVSNLVLAREHFGVDWDATTVDQKARLVEIRRPDGVPDALQQIEHGVLALLAQYRAIGHAIPGIIEPTLEQYTHLGDGASKTDNRVYAERLGPLDTDGRYSGVADDRWAFTSRSTALDYAAAAALAAAARALRGHDDALAQGVPGDGRARVARRARAAACRLRVLQHRRRRHHRGRDRRRRRAADRDRGRAAVREAPHGAASGDQGALPPAGLERGARDPADGRRVQEELASALRAFKATRDQELAKNPFGVPITTGNWGGAGPVAQFGVQMYFLHRAFPELVGPEYTLRAFDYVLGRHPASNLSYVSSVGTRSKLVATATTARTTRSSRAGWSPES